jgi:sugar/nucleoside kinase (ribokinase family)
MFDVACIGILVSDVIVKTIESIPERGKLSSVDSINMFSGGCAMSAAIDMAIIGGNVALLGKIGDDGFGMFLKYTLEKYGVNTEGLVVGEGSSTSASVVLVDGTGERSFLHCQGANAEFCESNINWKVVENSKIVFVAGTMLMPSFDGEPCARVLKKARELGKYTVLDTAWDSKGRWMNVLKPCMEYIDLFMPSYDEAVKFSGRDNLYDIAEVFFNLGVKTVVIKTGGNGCYIRETRDCEGYVLPTYTNIKPVDTTGAGDSFCAGFLSGMMRDFSLRECGRFANGVGTHCIMQAGAISGIKPYDDIIRFMKENEQYL